MCYEIATRRSQKKVIGRRTDCVWRMKDEMLGSGGKGEIMMNLKVNRVRKVGRQCGKVEDDRRMCVALIYKVNGLVGI